MTICADDMTYSSRKDQIFKENMVGVRGLEYKTISELGMHFGWSEPKFGRTLK